MIQRQIYFTTPGSSIHNHFILNKMELMFTILLDYQCHIEIVESHPDTQYISRVCLDALLELVDRLGTTERTPLKAYSTAPAVPSAVTSEA